jgi:hypothetical protein
MFRGTNARLRSQPVVGARFARTENRDAVLPAPLFVERFRDSNIYVIGDLRANYSVIREMQVAGAASQANPTLDHCA